MTDLTPGLSPLKTARRERLLDVAEKLFVTQGFRATTMEGIAEAAGLSKVTLYGYFSDKEAAFEGVAQRLAERLGAAVLAALAGEGAVAARVVAALTVKHAMIYDLVRASAFASELMAQKSVVQRIFSVLDARLIAAFAEVLGDGQIARILFHAAMGIANGSQNRAEMERDIERLVTMVLRPAP